MSKKIKTFDDLMCYLDGHGFETFDALEFISDSLSKKTTKSVIDEVVKEVTRLEKQAE